MGLLYVRLGDSGKAEEHFERAVKLAPNDSAAQTNYGVFLCSQQRYDEGERRFLQALKNSLYASPEVAYVNAGICAKGAGELDKAETYFRSALRIDPQIGTALFGMSEVNYEAGRFLPARAYLQRYLAIAEHSARSLWLGIRIERELGDKNALSSYAMLLKAEYPDSEETRLLFDSEIR
jgi:type IV pilus assembly protein PilF